MTLIDVRSVPDHVRWRFADRARVTSDIALPELSWWNAAPCPEHAGNGGPQAACQQCGVVLWRHQRVGATWLYWAKLGALCDTVGLGKTAQVAAVLAMCAETGEIPDRRAVVVCRPAAVGQWAGELERMVPGLRVIAAHGSMSVQQRVQAYLQPWDVLVISFMTLVNKTGGSDYERLRHFDIGTLVYDDLDPVRHPRTATHYAIAKLAATCDRVIGVHGTALQKKLPELHSFLAPLGGNEVLGTLASFKRRYVDTESVTFWTKQPCERHRGYHRDCAGCRSGRRMQKTIIKDGGIKEGMLPLFRERIAPLVLRRRAEDVEDSSLPDVLPPNQVHIELTDAQRSRYQELREGVLRRLREDGEEVSRPNALAAWMRGWQICSGLASLDDGADREDSSAKHDWVCDRLDGDLSEEKVVVFCYFRPNVAALSARLEARDIGHVLMWSEEQDSRERAARLARFREDPQCRVLVGTTTIEQSLNLQVARHLILMDTIRNPARMEQIVGRLRRQGSAWSHIYIHWLLAWDTQEDSLPMLLGREQSLIDGVWDETSDVFPAVSPADLMRAIAGRVALPV